MGWLDNLYQRGVQAKRVTPVTDVTHVQPDRGEAAPRPIARPPPKLERVWIQTAAPQPETGFPGTVEIGYFTVENGVLTMRAETGKATGAKQALAEGDNPRVIAGRLRRVAWQKASMGERNFNRRIDYLKIGGA
jgi:hypothetical protein